MPKKRWGDTVQYCHSLHLENGLFILSCTRLIEKNSELFFRQEKANVYGRCPVES